MTKNKTQLSLLLICILLFQTKYTRSYNLPPIINLGATNILDGGPLRPHPGFYWEQYLIGYHANKFLDAQGKSLQGDHSPKTTSTFLAIEGIYESSRKNILRGAWGIAAFLPITMSSTTSRNELGIINAGAGISNPVLSIYNQWQTYFHKGRPILASRIELDIYLPWGTNKFPKKTQNPSAAFIYLDPYWAATLYCNEKLSLSWRLHYLWCARDKKTHIKAGDTFHMNYSLEYQAMPQCWVGFCGYYLQQLKNSTLCGEAIPNSKERVVGLGPGALFIAPKECFIFVYIYFETKVQNRPQGIQAILRLLKHF